MDLIKLLAVIKSFEKKFKSKLFCKKLKINFIKEKKLKLKNEFQIKIFFIKFFKLKCALITLMLLHSLKTISLSLSFFSQNLIFSFHVIQIQISLFIIPKFSIKKWSEDAWGALYCRQHENHIKADNKKDEKCTSETLEAEFLMRSSASENFTINFMRKMKINEWMDEGGFDAGWFCLD